MGYYQQASVFRQARAGYEHAYELPFGKVVLGAQVASQGFLGGAIAAELGHGPVFGLVGWGRTNLKPYFNLNFDPNDAVLLGAGWRHGEDAQVVLYQVRDDRLGTGQRVTHLVARARPTGRTRWTVDVFHRSGYSAPEDGEWISSTGVAVTFDWDRWFARIAWDPNVNFTPNDMVRAALGVRF